MNCTYVVTDTKGELLRDLGEGFEQDGYQVTVLDTINLEQSVGYDPLRYVYDVDDIASMATMLLDAVSPKRYVTNDTFWTEAAEMLLKAVMGLLYQLECIDGVFAPGADPSSERRYLRMNNVPKLLKLIKITVANDGENACPLDLFVDAVESGKLIYRHFRSQQGGYGVAQYRDFRGAADRTLKSILITLNASISKLEAPGLQRIFEHDEMELDRVDDAKRFIDLKMSDNDSTNSWLANIALKQFFNLAQRKADASADGRLKRRVMFVLDEFPNVGRIPDFERSIATVRSRGINFYMCAQSLSQLEGVYGECNARTILDNCDSIVYMGGGSSIETQQYISKLCGESILGTTHVGVERTEMPVRDDVITPGEVGLMPRTECVVKISGMRPFRTEKYFCRDHPNAAKWLRS